MLPSMVLRWSIVVIIRRIVVFIDGDREYYEPDYILRRRSVQLIVALPPRGTI